MREQEVRNLWEAYLEVCEQETGRGPRISDTYDMRDAEGGPKGGGTIKIKGPKKKNVIRKEEVDLFDYILEHLVAEGYADTNEAALAIMANMSEDWRESIVEMNNLPSSDKTYAMKYVTGKPGGTMVYVTGKPTGKSVYKKGPDGRPSPYQPL